MRIESISLSKQVFEDMGVGMPNLPFPLELSNLGQVVVLAGKNGSGKTRLLSLVERASKKYLSADERRTLERDLSQTRLNLENSLGQIQRLESMGEIGPRDANELEGHRGAAANSRSEIMRMEKTLKASDAFKVRGAGRPRIVSFVPSSSQLGDPTKLLEEEAERLAEAFSTSLSSEGAAEGAPAYARQIYRAAVIERGHPKALPTDRKHQDAEVELQRLFANLLGADITLELNSKLNLQLEGFVEKYSTLLSEGQKVLFQLACMLHSRHAALNECVLFMDEPENHLHPAVLNDLVDRLVDLMPEGQIWISTHSVPLIAHLSFSDQNCLWFADAGKFAPAGRSPEKVLDSLLGGTDGARRVNELTLMPSRYASSIFLRQCLLAPGVIGYRGGDPQLDQIRSVLAELRTPGKALTVLDFGSGKGRLLDAIAQESSTTDLADVVDYLAYEPHIPDAELCQRHCLEMYGADDPTQRAFSSLEHLARMRGEKVVDVAVVCNVLHEVHPSDWIGEFGPDSALTSLLKEDGFILFIEDYALPVGERAHEYGFLLLDRDQLTALYQITSMDVEERRFTRNDHPSQGYKGRLIAHLVSAHCLQRMTPRTVDDAIASLNRQSLERLKLLLKEGHDGTSGSKRGRESALVTQLAANSALWLKDQAKMEPGFDA